MNELKVFQNVELGEVRTLIIDEEPWFVGRDVASILGYSKPLNALSTHVDRDDSLKQGLIDAMGRTQETILINESGLYSLIISSKLETAKKFKKWVTSEVLPAIRKHGMYAIDEILENPDMAIAALTRLKEEREKRKALEVENKVQQQQIAELKPKADYTDRILKNKGLVTISQIAKDYGMSGAEMNKKLHDLGVQYKQSGQWLLYRQHQSKGYKHSETVEFQHKDGRTGITMNTKWRQKGRLFLYELLKKNGILPTIEQD